MLMTIEPDCDFKQDMHGKSGSLPPKRQFAMSKRLVALVVFLGILTIAVVVLQFCFEASSSEKEAIECSDASRTGNCTITLVESIPRNVSFPSGAITNPSTYSGWMYLLEIAKKEIDIASFYWTLQGNDTKTTDPSTEQGDYVFAALEAAAKRGTVQENEA